MARVVSERADLLGPLAECFREHGYEGASLALIGEATGLGKGSLYHFFPGGKAEMMAAVLEDIAAWFEGHVFAPLESLPAATGIGAMCDAVVGYFESGRRICLVGVLALGDGRDAFADAVTTYFRRWVSSLRVSLERSGVPRALARDRAEATVLEIQGAIVLSRALQDAAVFRRAIAKVRRLTG